MLVRFRAEFLESNATIIIIMIVITMENGRKDVCGDNVCTHSVLDLNLYFTKHRINNSIWRNKNVMTVNKSCELVLIFFLLLLTVGFFFFFFFFIAFLVYYKERYKNLKNIAWISAFCSISFFYSLIKLSKQHTCCTHSNCYKQI